MNNCGIVSLDKLPKSLLRVFFDQPIHYMRSNASSSTNDENVLGSIDLRSHFYSIFWVKYATSAPPKQTQARRSREKNTQMIFSLRSRWRKHKKYSDEVRGVFLWTMKEI